MSGMLTLPAAQADVLTMRRHEAVVDWSVPVFGAPAEVDGFAAAPSVGVPAADVSAAEFVLAGEPEASPSFSPAAVPAAAFIEDISQPQFADGGAAAGGGGGSSRFADVVLAADLDPQALGAMSAGAYTYVANNDPWCIGF